MNSELNIGIVFSGGFAKGAYEIGFCKALLEYINIENIKMVSGSSIGAINAYGFINNKLDYLCNIWKSLEFKSAKEFFIKQEKRDIIYEYIEGLVGKDTDTDSNQKSCYINYIKVPNITLCYENVNNEDLDIQKGLLKASISVPTLYKPVFIKGNYYVDGAFLDNTPITPLKNKNLDLIFVLRFDHSSYNYDSTCSNTSIVEIVFDDDKKLRDYFYFNKHLTKKLIKEGYKQSKVILDSVFKCGDDIEYIKTISQNYVEKSKQSILPKSGEEVVNKMNKLSRIFKTECLEDIEVASDKIIIAD